LIGSQGFRNIQLVRASSQAFGLILAWCSCL